jgi:hypothetical protein
MPLLDGLFHKGDGGPVVIPVATQAPIAFRVYYARREAGRCCLA